MKEYMLISILSIPIISASAYYDIKWFIGICGAYLFIAYTYFYKLSFNNAYFAMAIVPQNYIESSYGSHKLISYGFSTLHALFISFCSTLYLLQIIDNYDIKQAFFISMSYYLADIYYVIDSTKKLTKLDYFTICHHNVMIIMYYIIFIQIDNDLHLENTLLYYMNRGLLAEYSVFTLNYSWYLVNTKQDNSNKMCIASILTLILYFVTRVVNFTRLIFNFWYDDLVPAIILMLPLFLVNYYWFYKLICKAHRIYKKNIQ
jgi:hypothetical protein